MTALFSDHEVHLKDYFYILRKRRGAILAFFLLVLLGGGVFTYFEKVLYLSSSTILIERENPNVVDFKEVMAVDAAQTDYYQTQYQMIKSRSLIRELFEKEKLAKDAYVQSLLKGRVRQFFLKSSFLPEWLRGFMVESYPEDVFIRKMLRVEPIRNSRLVQVSVIHPKASRAAEIANTLVQLYIQRNLKDRFAISQQATSLISGQLEELKVKVAEAQKKLQQYKEDKSLVNIPSIHKKDSFIQDAKLELVKVQAEESKLANRYLPAHPKMIHIRSQIEGLKQKIKEEEDRIINLSGTAIEYEELEREAQSSRQIYESLLKRLQETTSEAKTQASNITVVDAAFAPQKPYTPRPFLNMLAALFFGLAGGVLTAFFLEYLDSTIKIPEDIEHGLGMELLGIIPQAEKNTKGPFNGELFFSPDRPTPAYEALRALRTALLFKLRHVPGARCVLVSSPNPEEGKSTVIFNLAETFVQNHLKVILIDADLRKPRLHKIFEIEPARGLTDILEGDIPASQAIHSNIKGLGFDFLSCGSLSHHPTELLGSDRMPKLLKELKEQYDFIFIDCPPFLAVADVVVLSEYVDGIMIVTRYHKTEKRHLRNIRKRFSQPEKFMGTIINQVSVREQDHYYHQYYYYGYGNQERARSPK